MGVGREGLGGGHGKKWIGGWALGSTGPRGLTALEIGYLSQCLTVEVRLSLLLR